MVTPNKIYFEIAAAMEGTGRQQDFKHGQSKRTVLNLEQGEDVFLYLHEILLSIPSKHNNVTKVTRPSFPACNTEDGPRWGWWGAGNEARDLV